MRTRARVIAGILAAVLLVGMPVGLLVREHRTLYRATVLPPAGGELTSATAVNEQGQVVGWTKFKDGSYRLFLWDRQIGVRDLGAVSPVRDIGPVREGTVGLNDKGQIVAAMMDPNGNRRAFLRDPNGVREMLGALGGRESLAWSVNNAGQVVGWAQTSSGARHAFLWDRRTGMRDLGTAGGAESEARFINEAGQILGFATVHDGTPPWPCFWDSLPNTPARRLPTDRFCGLNNRGASIGQIRISDTISTMVVWRKPDAITELFSIDERHGHFAILPEARINDANQVLFTEVDSHPFWRFGLKINTAEYVGSCLWDPRRGRIPLDSHVPHEKGEGFIAVDLSNNGYIVGALYTADHQRSRIVLLEPIPQRWKKRPEP